MQCSTFSKLVPRHFFVFCVYYSYSKTQNTLFARLCVKAVNTGMFHVPAHPTGDLHRLFSLCERQCYTSGIDCKQKYESAFICTSKLEDFKEAETTSGWTQQVKLITFKKFGYHFQNFTYINNQKRF